MNLIRLEMAAEAARMAGDKKAQQVLNNLARKQAMTEALADPFSERAKGLAKAYEFEEELDIMQINVFDCNW